MTLETLAKQGNQNHQVSMAAAIGPRINEIRKNLIKECFSDFQHIEHRLEVVSNVHGITFINDSRATNINAAWYALESINKPIIWIAGGLDSGNDFSILRGLVNKKVKALICLGIDNYHMIGAFRGLDIPITSTQSITEAVELAYVAGVKGDTVLMSPGCASFDLFADFEERGNEFKKAVRNL
jgi:UDP-N-acetylmuramoylalanine--D-glutamate ligase